MILIVTIISLVMIGMVMVLLDFARFSRGKAKQATSAHCHSGGNIVIRAGRTYYTMPNGVERKIADRPMDLAPSSNDMRMFTAIMDKAHREYQDEQRASKRKEYRSMENIAKETRYFSEKSAMFNDRYARSGKVGDMIASSAADAGHKNFIVQWFNKAFLDKETSK